MGRRAPPTLCSPRLAGTRGQGLSHHQERDLRWEGATEETPQVIRQSAGGAERERVGRGASWKLVVQKTALGKGFWSLSLPGCTARGANAGTQRGSAAPAAAGGLEEVSAPRWLCAGLGSRAGRDAARKPLGDGPLAPADAQRGRRTRAAATSHCGFPDCPCPRHWQSTQPQDTWDTPDPLAALFTLQVFHTLQLHLPPWRDYLFPTWGRVLGSRFRHIDSGQKSTKRSGWTCRLLCLMCRAPQPGKEPPDRLQGIPTSGSILHVARVGSSPGPQQLHGDTSKALAAHLVTGTAAIRTHQTCNTPGALPKQPSAPETAQCSQRIFPVNELAAQHPQRAALPWAPHHSQLVGSRLNLTLKPSRQLLTEEK